MHTRSSIFSFLNGGVFLFITAFYLPLDLQRNLGGPKGYCCLFKDLDWLENWNWEDITLWRSHKFKFGGTRTVIGPLKFYLWGSNTCLAPPSSICEDQTHVWSFQFGIRGDQNSGWFPQFYLLLSSYKEIKIYFATKQGISALLSLVPFVSIYGGTNHKLMVGGPK